MEREHLTWLKATIADRDPAVRYEFALDCVRRSFGELWKLTDEQHPNRRRDILLLGAVERRATLGAFPEADLGDAYRMPYRYLVESVHSQVCSFIEQHHRSYALAAYHVGQANLDIIGFFLERVEESRTDSKILKTECQRQRAFFGASTQPETVSLFGGALLPEPQSTESSGGLPSAS